MWGCIHRGNWSNPPSKDPAAQMGSPELQHEEWHSNTCHEDEPQHSVGRGQCHDNRDTMDKEESERILHHKKNTKQRES